MYGLAITPDDKIILSGFDGKVLKSDDKSQNWVFKQMNLWKFYLGIACPENNKYVFISGIGYLSGNVVITDSN